MRLHRLVCILVASFVCLSTASAQMVTQPAAAKPLHALFDASWEYHLAHNPVRASILGDRRWNSQWPDVSLSSLNAEHQQMLQFGRQLAAINRAQLSPEDRLNYDLFKHNLDNEDQSFKLKLYLIPLNQRDGIQTSDQIADAIHFETVKDYEDWITRLKTFSTYMDQTIALLQAAGGSADSVGPRSRLLSKTAAASSHVIQSRCRPTATLRPSA